jgi:beta-lactamase class A
VQQNLARLGISGMRVDRSERSMAIDLLEAARPGSVTARDRAFLTALDESLSVEERASYAESYQSDPRDRATPVAMVQLLAKFQRGAALSPGSTKLLRDMMTAAQSRIGAKLLNPVEVANKTGTGMGTFNDIGIVTLPDGRHLALAIYTARARNISWDAGNALVADIAKAVVDALP